MRNHGGCGRQGDYSFETERTTIPEIIIYSAIGIGFLIYDTTKKILTIPVKGLEKLGKGTIKGLGGFEESDID